MINLFIVAVVAAMIDVVYACRSDDVLFEADVVLTRSDARTVNRWRIILDACLILLIAFSLE